MNRKTVHQIPQDILDNPNINDAINTLPKNYNFEIHKTIWKIKCCELKRVALQFPEGLLMFSCVIADILERFCDVEVIIMADVTYGACCVDDFSARALGCELLVHYGHSCLVPLQVTSSILVLYIFVSISLDISHILDTVTLNFEQGSTIAFVSTIQFVACLQTLQKELSKTFKIVLPQCKPLSPGEILGCTAPKLSQDTSALIYVGDGRFHLEAVMIANPSVTAYKYDPYVKELTREYYDHDEMMRIRHEAVLKSKNANHFGLILGTLGRQGNPKILNSLEEKIESCGRKFTRLLMSEIFPQRLSMVSNIDVFVQIACPRLSIDWGRAFSRPVVTPYEANVALNSLTWQERYPMDFYADDSLGPWTNNNVAFKPARIKKRAHVTLETGTEQPAKELC